MESTADTLRSVRGIPDDVWQELRAEAERQKRPIGALLTEAITLRLMLSQGQAAFALPATTRRLEQ